MHPKAESLEIGQLKRHVVALFEKRFAYAPEFALAAPGRVNLIGEHTDYNGGFVFPMAIERYVVMAAAVRRDDSEPSLRIYSESLDEQVTISLARRPEPDVPRWADYVRGVIAGFWDRGHVPPALDVVLMSTVPLGAGLSSSAALEVATATLLEVAVGIRLAPADKAMLCQRAEHEFAKVPCGIMDQLASVEGRKTGALWIDCRDHSTRLVPLSDPRVGILVCNSRVKHSLADGEYAKRRAACTQAAALLGVPQLRDADEAQVRASRDLLPSPLFECALHVVTENQRVGEFANALIAGELIRAGELMYDSHASLSRDYRVSCPELDLLVAAARGIGIAGGVYGSRMTGGGFGGCTVSLIATERTTEITERLSREYLAQTGKELETFVTRPSEAVLWAKLRD